MAPMPLGSGQPVEGLESFFEGWFDGFGFFFCGTYAIVSRFRKKLTKNDSIKFLTILK